MGSFDTFHFENVNDEFILVSLSRNRSDVVAGQVRIIARPADLWQDSFPSEDLLQLAGREKRLFVHALHSEGSPAGVTRKFELENLSHEFVKELDAVTATPAMTANLRSQEGLNEMQLLVRCSWDLI